MALSLVCLENSGPTGCVRQSQMPTQLYTIVCFFMWLQCSAPVNQPYPLDSKPFSLERGLWKRFKTAARLEVYVCVFVCMCVCVYVCVRVCVCVCVSVNARSEIQTDICHLFVKSRQEKWKRTLHNMLLFDTQKPTAKQVLSIIWRIK